MHTFHPRARIHWYDIVCQHVLEHFNATDDQGVDQPVHLLTLIDDQQCTSWNQHEPVSLRHLRHAYCRHLHFLDYIGVIEPAFYRRISTDWYGGERGKICWHFHGLVWGLSEQELRARCERIRLKIKTFIPRATSADVRRIGDTDLPRVLAYMLKSPRTQYAIRRRNRAEGLKQFQEPFSGINAARLYYAMHDIHLDHLLVGSGEGCALVDAITYDALAPWRRAKGKPHTRAWL